MDTSDQPLKPLVEGIVFASEHPLKAEQVAEVIDGEVKEVRRLLNELVAEYADLDRGFRLYAVADGYQFRTREEYAEALRRFNKSKPFRFSRAALETLSIIAYRQPITRGEIEYLRGVDSGGVLRTLLEKHLLRILGKKDIPGRPILYGTSREFLELFGLRDLTGLPTLKEFSELDGEIDALGLQLEGAAEVEEGSE
ncbi:MAG: SMC-Scp complex subunit ScpB [Desulfuromonas sp.]|nr:MAG: SMC-Scp complex subunit ScpB [Desulfuromonas sp.]